MRRCAAEAGWVVDRGGLKAIHFGARKVCELAYPEAAIWDLVCRGCSGTSLVEKIALIAGVPAREAEALIEQAVARWIADGFLVEGQQ